MTSCCAPEALLVWWLDSFWKIRAFLDDTRQLLSMWFQGKRRRVLGCTQPTVPRSPESGLSCCHWGTRWPLVRKHSDKWKVEGKSRQGQMPQGQTGCLILSAWSLPVPTVQRPIIPDLNVSTGWEECDPACAAHPAPTRAASFVMC